jgi:translocation and assembly module TamB
MTQSPNSGSDPNLEPTRPRRSGRFRRIRRILLPLGIGLVAVAGAGAWWGWRFAHEDLAPLVASNLSKTLNRPVKIGKLEGLGFRGLRFGSSAIPATATDRDRATVEEIAVGFDLIQTLLTRKLKLDVTLIKPNLYLEQTKEGWITTEIKQQEEKEGPIELTTLRVRDARVEVLPLGAIAGKRAPITLSGVSGEVDVFDKNKRFAYQVTGKSTTGGELDLMGETRVPSLDTKLQVRAQNFQVAEVDRFLNLPFDLPTGKGGGNLNVHLGKDIKRPPVNGTANFENVTVTIPGMPRSLTKATGKLQFRDTQIQLENAKANYGKANGVANGLIDLGKERFNLAVKMPSTSLPDVLDALKVPFPLAVAGAVRADLKLTGSFKQPVLSGIAQSTQLGKLDQVPLSRYQANFALDMAAREIRLSNVQATPTMGGQVTGSGRIDLAKTDGDGKVRPELQLNLLAENVPGDEIARPYNGGKALPVKVGLVNAQARIFGPADNVQTLVRWKAPQAIYPGKGEVLVSNGTVKLRDTTFAVAGGEAQVEGAIANGRWQGILVTRDIPLKQFSADLRGLFSGRFTAAGSLANFNPAAIQAQGTARFSEGISILKRPLTAQVQWNGKQILVQQATAPGFSAQGAIAAKLEGPPAITGLDLNVRLDDYDLQEFPASLPAAVTYSGRADFVGKVQGAPTAPKVRGNVALKQFVVNGIAFEPYLQGPLDYGPGVRIDLKGNRDRIAAVLDSRFQPLGFEIRRGDAIAQGRKQGELLLTDVKNLPLSLLQAAGLSSQFPPSGLLNGNFTINLAQQTANGDIEIINPGFGLYKAEKFTGRINVANGIATLTGGTLQRGNIALQIAGTANLLGANPQAKAQIKVVKADIQEVLKTLQFFEIADFQRGGNAPTYGDATTLQTVPVDMTNVPIQDQLRRLAELEALLAQEKNRREAEPLPELRELKGQFTGTIDLALAPKTGLKADFNLQGEQFQWGKRFSAQQVVAIGSFENGALTLLPLRLQISDDAVIAFSGQLFGEKQSGQLRVENLPIELLTGFVALPLDVDGVVNATATLSGSFKNPQAVGSLSLNNGVLNATPVKSARGSFTYANGRLDFSNTLALDEKEPLSVVGSLPLPLAFAAVKPDSDQISLDINVKNEGLALLNLVTNQVGWVDGKGEVTVQVRGSLATPVATGIARVENATIQARALPEALTNVTGIARFDSDRVRVEKIEGSFSKGKVIANGVIPLANRLTETDADTNQPLTVSLNQLRLNLKGLYQGGVDGDVTVTGTAFNPVIGGAIRLSNGQVLLSDPEELKAQTGATTEPTGSPVEFAGLELELGKGVSITRQPLLSFVAAGKLTIDGNLNDLRPNGVIRLNSGQVNLFTTQFTLERGYRQTAEFIPERKLDPDLDIRLVALVPEVINRRQPSVLSQSEILDVPAPASSYGSLKTVRVRAQVQGPASRLSDNLKLSSSPPRSTEEIVALIGGGFVDTLGRGDTLLGIANLAGSALLTNIQTAIGNALGLSEFRLFPTNTTRDDRNQDSRSATTFGLAAEGAVDITPALSVSILKILTNSQPPQFGLRYRINDYFLIRSSTDFSGDTRAAIEYEARF